MLWYVALLAFGFMLGTVPQVEEPLDAQWWGMVISGGVFVIALRLYIDREVKKAREDR